MHHILLFSISAFIFLFAIYGFDTNMLAEQKTPTFCKNSTYTAICTTMKSVPIPLSNFLRGAFYQLSISRKGWPSFILGHTSINGWWYYYPVSFVLKNQLPLSIFLLLFFLLFFLHKNFRSQSGVSDRFLLLFLVPTILYFMIFSKLNIGLRYLFPLFPIVFLLCGRTTVFLLKKNAWTSLLAISLLLWYIASWIQDSSYPLSYSNELTGGPGKTFLSLSDSDNDWGQGLPQLKKYMDTKNIPSVALLYFGYDEPSRYGITSTNFPLEHCQSLSGFVAISTTPLMNPFYTKNRNCIEWVKTHAVSSNLVGYTIQTFQLPKLQ